MIKQFNFIQIKQLLGINRWIFEFQKQNPTIEFINTKKNYSKGWIDTSIIITVYGKYNLIVSLI